MSKIDIEQLAKDYLNGLRVVSKNEFSSIPLAFIAGYQKATEAQKQPAMSFLPVLLENLEAMKRYGKTNLSEKEKAENEAIQETLEDLIAIYKAKY